MMLLIIQNIYKQPKYLQTILLNKIMALDIIILVVT